MAPPMKSAGRVSPTSAPARAREGSTRKAAGATSAEKKITAPSHAASITSSAPRALSARGLTLTSSGTGVSPRTDYAERTCEERVLGALPHDRAGDTMARIDHRFGRESGNALERTGQVSAAGHR